MHFLLYSRINADNIGRSLGAPEYSYYFLLKEFRVAFERLGSVTIVEDPAAEADAAYDRCRARGEDCVLVAFTAPQNLPEVRRCPVVPLIAWEFERIPDEPWGDNPRNDWRVALAGCACVITLSEHAAAAVKRTMGADFPVLSVPVPLWERMDDVRERCASAPEGDARRICVDGAVFDTRDFEKGPDRLRCNRPYAAYALELWDGHEHALDFRLLSPDTGALLGFYRPEPWGAWSRNDEVWIALPWLLHGDVAMELELRAYGRNQGRPLVAGLGDSYRPLRIGGGEERHTLRFRLERPARMLHITGIDPRPLAGAAEERSIGVGITSLRLLPAAGAPSRGPIRLELRAGYPEGALLQEFWAPESWGTWSASAAPWLMLPRPVHGRVTLRVGIIGYAQNVETPITFYLGGQTCTVVPRANVQALKLDFDLPEPAQVLGFTGVSSVPSSESADPRTLGIGLCCVAIDELEPPVETPARPRPVSAHLRQQLALHGTVYTSVLNPLDDRKNWVLLVSAFCTAFADRDDVTLLLKMTHNLQRSYIFELHKLMQRLPAFACRVVAVHGFLDEQDYGELVRRTDFYVNVSKAEGLCIPLMEFMSCGKPALAPRHTSLLDYLDDSNSIAIEATTEPCIWPHDERAVLRTLQYRVSWESTVAALRRSFSVYHEDPDSYRRMGAAAAGAMARYCGIDGVTADIGAFLDAALPRAGGDE
jgi:glycosyltransferase involved in cell wall biosynthesis